MYKAFITKPYIILFIINLLCIFTSSREIVQRKSTINLACMHIENAIFQMKKSITISKKLSDACNENLSLLKNDFRNSFKRAVDNSNHSIEIFDKLITVQNIIETCMSQIIEDQDSTDSYLLREIKQSLIYSKKLINKKSTYPPFKEALQTSFNNKGGDPLVYNEKCLTTLRHSTSDSNFMKNSEINENFIKYHDFTYLASTNQYSSIPPIVNITMNDSIIIDYCADHTSLEGQNATIYLNKGCGGKIHSRSKYQYGVFAIQMKAPFNASGVSSSFHISSNDLNPDIISFDLIGNAPHRVLTTYIVNGSHVGPLETFHMDFDTSLEFHKYTIKWDANSIIWMIDNIVIRTLRSHRVNMYPRKAGHIFGYIWDASYIANGNWAGKMDWKNGPFFIHYNDLQIISPLNPKQWRPPPQRPYKNVPMLLQPLVIEYCASNIAVNNHLKNFAITFDQFGCGSRARSINSYTSGKFEAHIKCAIGDTSGLLTSMYLSSKESTIDQDEIDFEFLGNNKEIVQTNFYVNGTGGHELWVNLGFDCSQDYHNYAIHYNKYHIKWFVDSKLVRIVLRNDQIANQKPYPVKRMFLYVSVWNASSVEDGMWTGKWHGGDMPYIAQYSNVTIQSP